MEEYFKRLAQRLTDVPQRKLFIYDGGLMYFRIWGKGSWSKWQPWGLNFEAELKYKSYVLDNNEAVKDINGHYPMAKIMAEVFIQGVEDAQHNKSK